MRNQTHYILFDSLLIFWCTRLGSPGLGSPMLLSKPFGYYNEPVLIVSRLCAGQTYLAYEISAEPRCPVSDVG
jgi:hypothetical protein